MVFNSIIILPLPPIEQIIEKKIDPNNDRKKWQDLLPAWASEIEAFGEETFENIASYSPPSKPSAPLIARCYSRTVFSQFSISHLKTHLPDQIFQEMVRHTLEYAVPKLNTKDLKILVPSHGSPLGIGSLSNAYKIPPEMFADQIYYLLHQSCKIPQIQTLAIRFLSCNSATPYEGTAPLEELSSKSQATYLQTDTSLPKKRPVQNHPLQVEQAKNEKAPLYNTSFIGRFSQHLIKNFCCYGPEDFLIRIRISVSGVLGYYQHFTKGTVEVFATSECAGTHTPLQNALVTFIKPEGQKDLNVIEPKTLLRVPPFWLLK